MVSSVRIRVISKDMDRDHLTDDEIWLFHERQLTGSSRLSLSEHLRACPTCRSRVFPPDSFGTSGFDLSGLVADDEEHLSYEEMAGLVDRLWPAGEIERIEDHLRSCDECAAEVRQLQELRDETSVGLVRPRPLQPSKPAAVRRGWPRALALAASVVLAVGIIYVLWQSRLPPPDVSRTDRATAQAQPPAASQAGPAEQIRDGGRVITVTAGGVSGLDDLDDRQRRAIERALLSRQ